MEASRLSQDRSLQKKTPAPGYSIQCRRNLAACQWNKNRRLVSRFLFRFAQQSTTFSIHRLLRIEFAIQPRLSRKGQYTPVRENRLKPRDSLAATLSVGEIPFGKACYENARRRG